MDINDIAIVFALFVWPVILLVGFISEVDKYNKRKARGDFTPRPGAPPPVRGLTKEEEARDAIAGDIVGREMGWWD